MHITAEPLQPTATIYSLLCRLGTAVVLLCMSVCLSVCLCVGTLTVEGNDLNLTYIFGTMVRLHSGQVCRSRSYVEMQGRRR